MRCSRWFEDMGSQSASIFDERRLQRAALRLSPIRCGADRPSTDCRKGSPGMGMAEVRRFGQPNRDNRKLKLLVADSRCRWAPLRDGLCSALSAWQGYDVGPGALTRLA